MSSLGYNKIEFKTQINSFSNAQSVDLEIKICYNVNTELKIGATDVNMGLRFKIDQKWAKKTVKELLLGSGISVTLLKKVKFGGILLNGNVVTVRAILSVGDEVLVVTPEEKSEGIPPMDIPLKIAYEDEYILVVDKPKNMPTHPSKGNNLPTLANAVMWHYGGNFVFRSINRLDRDTSGLVIIGKNQLVAGKLSESMKRGEFRKFYECIVEGVPTPSAGLIDEPIERECEGSIKRVVREDGKKALTEYTVIETFENASKCLVRLHTGRTHQIRVHMAHIGHPLVGDFLYGNKDSGDFHLRCIKIDFPHPITKESLSISASDSNQD